MCIRDSLHIAEAVIGEVRPRVSDTVMLIQYIFIRLKASLLGIQVNIGGIQAAVILQLLSVAENQARRTGSGGVHMHPAGPVNAEIVQPTVIGELNDRSGRQRIGFLHGRSCKRL